MSESKSTRAERAKQEVQSDPDTPTKIAEAINGFGELYARHVGGNNYRVLSLRNGSVTAHTVNVHALTCSCEDMEYNTDGAEVCDHLAVALFQAPARISVEDHVLNQLLELYEASQDGTDGTEATVTANSAPNASDASDAGTDASDESDKPPANPDYDAAKAQKQAEDAATKLQEAYDDLVDDMQVQAHEGLVWLQTGRDTPDDWPHPGGGDTWEVLIGNPDQPMYIHDEHDLFTDKPGEWWKNALYPSDVDDYISEVLG
jgi:hypothetical protein